MYQNDSLGLPKEKLKLLEANAVKMGTGGNMKSKKIKTLELLWLLVCIGALTLSWALVGCVAGPEGAQGVTGAKGDQGSSPVVTTQPATSQECLNGGSEILVNGVEQTVICNGVQGQPGLPGTPGTKITLVQFCAETPSYPSTFPEVGLCIDGNLYAVYSIPGSFLALITPGRYQSNGIGSSCSFTVLPNCEVVR